MNEKTKYLITGFLIGTIAVLFSTYVVLSSSNSSSNFQMMRGYGNNQFSDNLEEHFIEQMIPHHEDAIKMSELALEKATRPEVRELAQDIITSQSEEIDQMKIWYKSWFGNEYQINDFEMGYGMMSGRIGMMNDFGDLEDLENSEDFDKEFIEQMIPHHQMGIMMTRMLLRNPDKKELKELGDNIIKTQSLEIKLMQGWLDEWNSK